MGLQCNPATNVRDTDGFVLYVVSPYRSEWAGDCSTNMWGWPTTYTPNRGQAAFDNYPFFLLLILNMLYVFHADGASIEVWKRRQ